MAETRDRIVETKLYPVRRELRCGNCAGEMVASFLMDGTPEKWLHECKACGEKEWRDEKFPAITYATQPPSPSAREISETWAMDAAYYWTTYRLDRKSIWWRLWQPNWWWAMREYNESMAKSIAWASRR